MPTNSRSKPVADMAPHELKEFLLRLRHSIRLADDTPAARRWTPSGWLILVLVVAVLLFIAGAPHNWR